MTNASVRETKKTTPMQIETHAFVDRERDVFIRYSERGGQIPAYTLPESRDESVAINSINR